MTGKFAALRAAFATDKAKESDGTWVDYMDGISVKVRRSTHPMFKKAMRKAFRRFKHMGSALTPEQEDIIKNEAVANGLIVDWKIGEDTPFTPDAALEVFIELPDFRRWCEEQGDDVDNFKDEREADLGNSSASSPGIASGEAQND